MRIIKLCLAGLAALWTLSAAAGHFGPWKARRHNRYCQARCGPRRNRCLCGHYVLAFSMGA
jgi:hypothetical protein